jgi:7-cyano-7-deazaguanine synthase
MDRKLGVVLVSGGLDSCVTAAVARQNYETAFLHINYGHRTEERELRAFNAIADYYGVKHRLATDISYLKQIGGSSLVDPAIAVELSPPSSGTIPSTYVPFRNAHLLAIAVSWAEVIGARAIFIGAVEQDSAGYPDCRPPFFDAFSRLIREGTKPSTQITIDTPLISLRKKEIVLLGNKLHAPLHLTWSCYQNSERACGRCSSCLLRLKGFHEAGSNDPVPYAIPV